LITRLSVLLPLIWLQLAACATVEAEPPTMAPQPRYAAYAKGSAISSALRFEASTGTGGGPRLVELVAGESSARLGVGQSTVRIDALEVALEDLRLEVDEAGPALRLGRLGLRLDGATLLSIAGRQPTALVAAGIAPLSLGWSLVLPNGSEQPLGPVQLPSVQLEVALVDLGGRQVLAIDASCAGDCVVLPGIVTIRDASLHLELPARLEAEPITVL